MTPQEYMQQMTLAVAAESGATQGAAPTYCPVCHAPKQDCICEMIGVVNAVEPSVIDGVMYDGRMKPAMVVADDEGWRKL